MQQNLDSMYDRELTGTFTITQDDYGCYVLNGSYDWGRGDWTSTYNVKGIKHDGSSMTWTSTADESDVSVYVRIDSLPELK
ncbi:MAG: hypothetical protein HUJ94_07325, partial [Bacteroidales bacterium]|nr:hypothetical protein [Bacteroidales bacterium]